MNPRHILVTALIPALLVAAAGCSKSNDGKSPSASPVSSAPVTITVALDGVSLDDVFMDNLKPLLSKKYPNITLEYVKAPPGQDRTLDKLMAAGQTPDLIISYNGYSANYKTVDLLYDMRPLIKNRNFDLSRFDPKYMEDANIAGSNGEVFAIPISVAFHAMYYNKDLFDKFGVAYPTDGMTWDQVVQLTRKMSRTVDGIAYHGLDTGGPFLPAQPLGAAAIDKDNNPTANTDTWKMVFNVLKSIYTIPGNDMLSNAKNSFLKDKTLAMYSYVNMIGDLLSAAKDGLNWDVVQYPSWPQAPNTYGNASVIEMLVTKTSAHKDQAMQVIEVATSDEQQLAMSKLALISPLKDNKFKTVFGSGQDGLKGKNLQGIFKSQPVKYPIASKYRSKAESIMKQEFVDFVNNKVDLNTALALSDEGIKKMVQQEESK